MNNKEITLKPYSMKQMKLLSPSLEELTGLS